jgi:glycosyltransferase involved in cell wall biosynthesis
MRIGMLVDVYKPHVSGITNYVSLNKKILEEAGHEVFVLTFGEDDYPDDEQNIIRSPGLSLVKTDYYLSLSYKREARHLLRTFDIAHVHHPFLSGAMALRYCRPRGIPIIFTNHTRYDLYAQAYMKGLPEVISETMIQTYLPAFCSGVNRVVAPSEGLRQILLKLNVNADIAVIPNGVEIGPFKAIQPGRERNELDFQASDCVLIYVGRLGPEKNLSFLLRSFAGVANAFDNVRLMIVGDGPERENLQAASAEMGIQRKVTFTGMVNYPDLPRFLSCADAFVTASVTEVHPLSVIEAMAAGLPVLGILSPGVGDTITDGMTGYLSTEDIAAFTAKMVKMVSDDQKRLEMGALARQHSENYDIRRTSRLMEACYRDVIAANLHRKNSPRARLTRFLDNIKP